MSYEPHKQDGNVFNASTEDLQMNWAMEKARLTINYFRESLRVPEEGQYGHSLKVRLEDENGTEHMWLHDLSLDDDGLFYGVIDSEPVTVRNVRLGSKIGVPHEAISDWLLVEGGRLIGGYTIRVYRETLEPEERRSFDQEFGLVIDYGVDHFPADMSTPEGAIISLEDAYTRGDLAGALACKDFVTEAGLLLAQLPNLGEAGQDMVDQTAETLRLSFEAHLRGNGMPSFEGVRRAFPEREWLDKDTVLVTEICYLPDGRSTFDRLICTRHGDEWRVGPPIQFKDEDEAE